jgi:DNA-binding NarL/FixJ family response regulator
VIHVLVADDQALIRNAVRDLVAHEADLYLVGTATNGLEAVRLAQELRPDVVVMDVRMPLLDGIEATHLITRNPDLSSVRVLVLTTFDDDPELVVRGVRSGAAGFVGKAAEPDVVLAAIRTVHAGDGLLSPRATRHLLDRHTGSRSPAAIHADLHELTEREIDVLRLVAEGWANQRIGEHLGIEAVTVKTHVNRMMAKLARHDRSQLVVLAYETGLVIPRYR